MYWVLCLLLVFDAFSLRETVVLRFCHFQGLISSFGETCNLDADCIETVNHNVFHIQKQYLIVFFIISSGLIEKRLDHSLLKENYNVECRCSVYAYYSSCYDCKIPQDIHSESLEYDPTHGSRQSDFHFIRRSLLACKSKKYFL